MLKLCIPDVSSTRHRPTADSEKINSAVERVAAGDDAFVDSAVSRLEGLQFPAFKFKIIEHVKSAGPEVAALFESLDGYIEYRDAYHVRKAIEENAPKHKKQNQDDLARHQEFERGASRDVKIPDSKVT